VYIGGGQSSDANSTVNVDLSNQSVSSTGLGLAGTSVLTTAPVVIGGAAATAIASGHTDTFTIDTANEAHSISVTGETGDTVQGQVNELNAQLNVLGITASLNSLGKLQLQSASAFTVKAATNATDLVANNATAINTGLNNDSITSLTAGDTLAITVGSATASFAITGAASQAQVDGINQALAQQGISGVTAVMDATTAGGISLQGASTFSVNDSDLTNGTTDNGYVAAVAGGDPNAAINAITQAVQSLGTVQGIVGAGENTLNYAINLAQSQITSFSAAQSQIRDANVAAEAANLTKAQVLQQASIAAMAQANQEPQAVLALLKQ